MDYITYLKREIEKIIFIETFNDIKIKDTAVIKKGKYPILSEDLIGIAQNNIDEIPAAAFINGMLYIIACDENFIHNGEYIDTLKPIEGIKGLIITWIEQNKEKNLKKALIYSSALCRLYPEKEFRMNKIYILIKIYEERNLDFLEKEIVSELTELSNIYPEYAIPSFHLGQYYLDKDINISKMYLSRCLNDNRTRDEAIELLEKIKITEEYDNAVELVKEGQGNNSLNLLLKYLEYYPDNLNARYYLSVALRQSGRYEDALNCLNELLTFGELPEIYNEIGLNLALLNEYESACAYFKKSLKIKPDDSGIISNIGACYLNLGNFDEAEKAFSLAVRINPKDEIAQEWLKQIKGGY